MRKQNKQRKNRKSPAGSKASANPSGNGAEVSASRRKFLSRMKTAAIAAPVIGALGYYSLSSIQASIREGDLTQIGNGTPAIVQIHDPQCSLCQTLQNQTRDVLDDYNSDQYEYLVANIKTRKGSQLAAQYSVPHVTLLLFDPQGNMTTIIRGPTSPMSVRNQIAAHLEKYGVKS